MKKKIYSVILSIAMVLSSVDSSMYVHASKAVTGTAVTEQEVTASKNTPSANVSTADVMSDEKDANDGKGTLANNESSKESQDVNGPVAVYSDLSSDDDSVIEISSESDLLALVEQGMVVRITIILQGNLMEMAILFLESKPQGVIMQVVYLDIVPELLRI